jgi:hypothetical protein
MKKQLTKTGTTTKNNIELIIETMGPLMISSINGDENVDELWLKM